MTISPLAAPAQATVDYLGEMHLYRQLAKILRDQICSGELPLGRSVPSIPQLAEQHKIAHRTARQALALLEEEHLVRVLPGRGTYVLARQPG